MARTPALQRAQARALIDAILAEAISDDPEESPTIAELIESAAGGRSKSGYVRQVISELGIEVAHGYSPEDRRAINDRLNHILQRAQQRQIDAMIEDGHAFNDEIRQRLDGAASRLEDADARAAEAEADLLHTKVSQDVTERLLGIASTVPRAAPAPDQPATELPDLSAARPVRASRSSPAKTKPLSNYMDSYSSWRLSQGTTHQVLNQEMMTYRKFIEFAGDRPPNAYDRGDVTGFLDKIRQLPIHHGKSKNDAERTMDELIAKAVAENKPRGLTSKTMKRHLSTLSQIFMHIVNAGSLSLSNKAELTKEFTFRSTQGSRDQRDVWTGDELVRLFGSPVWAGCESEQRRSAPGNEIIRDARFWLPLLALYHGARVEEFADLYGRDIGLVDGVRAFRITPMAEDETAGVKARTLKTFAAKRTVPIHPELVRVGFLDYVARVCRSPDDALFPDLTPEGKDQKRGPQITRWFGRYRKDIGVYRPGVGMHAFRHLVATKLSDKITDLQQQRHRDYLLGHAPSGTEGSTRYDKGPGLVAAASTLALLDYPELDFSHLYVG